MPPRVRKPVIRTCVVCRQPLGKNTMQRIVRTPTGTVEADPTGKRSGRGAYICSQVDCRSGPAAQRALSRALGVPISADLFAPAN